MPTTNTWPKHIAEISNYSISDQMAKTKTKRTLNNGINKSGHSFNPGKSDCRTQ